MRLHEVVDLATSDAPPDRNTIDEIVGKGRRVQRRRRAGFAGAGAALAVVAVSAAVALPSLSRGTGETVAPPAAAPAVNAAPVANWQFPDDPFTFTFDAFEVGRWKVAAPIVASTSYQIASVYLDGRKTNDRSVTDEEAAEMAKNLELRKQGKARAGEPEKIIYAYLVLYRPGAFDPAKLSGAKQLTVDGKKAYQTFGPGHGGMAQRALAWEYADNAYAVLETHSNGDDDPSAEEMQKIVSGLKPSAKPAKATLPFTLDYVPAGYQPVELGVHAMSGLNGIAAAREGDYGGAIFSNKPPATTGLIEPYGGVDGANLPNSFEIFVVPAENSNQTTGTTEIKCGNGFCTHRSPDGKVSIQVASEGRLSDAEMTKVLKGLKLADVKDDSTWTDAATALS
ncbi:hypothetical protein [Actinoplanes missouriensis]|uniref:hypothetical protein n=1 Tax=Actinoplanes missouriensis TaxID=1866 RepID=UPI0002FE6E14|nr:hypothetical protein [Actinoplanes missouriensis]